MSVIPGGFNRRDVAVILAPLGAVILTVLAPVAVEELWLTVALVGLGANLYAFVDAVVDVRQTRALIAQLPHAQQLAATNALHAELRRELVRIVIQLVFVTVGVLAVMNTKALAVLLAPMLIYAESLVAASGWADRSARKERLAILETG